MAVVVPLYAVLPKPPVTVGAGFGSSAYNGTPFPAQMYVQTYVKQ